MRLQLLHHRVIPFLLVAPALPPLDQPQLQSRAVGFLRGYRKPSWDSACFPATTTALQAHKLSIHIHAASKSDDIMKK